MSMKSQLGASLIRYKSIICADYLCCDRLKIGHEIRMAEHHRVLQSGYSMIVVANSSEMKNFISCTKIDTQKRKKNIITDGVQNVFSRHCCFTIY